MKGFCSFILVLVANEVVTFSPAPSSKAKFIEWSTRLSMEVNLEEYLGGSETPLSVMKWKVSEKKFEGDVGIGLLLPSSCPSVKCDVSTCPVPGGDQQSKFVMYRQEDRTWDVECRLFYDDELPLVDGGSVEQRSLSDSDSMRLDAKAFKTKMTPVVTPSIDDSFELKQVLLGDSSVDSTTLTLESNPNLYETSERTKAKFNDESCEALFMADPKEFFYNCCMKTIAAEANPKCTIMYGIIANKFGGSSGKHDVKKTKTNVEEAVKTSDAFGVTEKNVESIRLESKSLPNVEVDDVVWSLSNEISSWRSKYFVVLGFFLVFLIVFVLVVAVLIYKLRKKEEALPPSSPGASDSCTNQNFGNADDGENAPLTPAVSDEKSFKY